MTHNERADRAHTRRLYFMHLIKRQRYWRKLKKDGAFPSHNPGNALTNFIAGGVQALLEE